MSILSLITFSAIALAQDDPNLIAPTDPLRPEEQIKLFKLPEGFSIELITADPEIGQPTNISFDSTGRLWINSTLEYPYPASDKPRDRVRYMDDANGDGVPDTIRTFATGMNIPMGIAKVKEGVLCFSIPNIYLLRDKDGDGVADDKQIAYTEFGFRDTHGMASSFRPWIDGWVYACHGFANDSSVKGSAGEPVKMNSGNSYRIRSNGSAIQQMTWGQVNPFGLAFDPLGNLYSSDCHTKPAYMLLRGGYYPSFGKPHDGLGFAPEMMEHLHGSTGIAGLVYYAATHFPEDFQNNLFIGNPVTGRVNRDQLEWHGSSPRAIEMPDFLSCEDRWFRPVDIALAPDGSLYVADFYNCIIGHYEVPLPHPRRDRQLGRIWRITYKASPVFPADTAPPMPNLTKLSAEQLVEKLADANITVRTLATNELVDRVGRQAVEPARQALAESSIPEQRAHALWVVERLAGLTPEEIRSLASDPTAMVRVHLVRAMGERPDWSTSEVRSVILGLLAGTDPFVQRVSAEVLGRHPHLDNINALLGVKPADQDTHLAHTIKIALRNNLRDLGRILQVAQTLGNGPALLDRFAEVSLGIPNADAGSFILAYLEFHPDLPRVPLDRRAEYFHHVARYVDSPRLAELASVSQRAKKWGDGEQLAILRSLANGMQERGETLEASLREWAVSLAKRLLSTSDVNTCRAGIDFAKDLRLADATEPLARLCGEDSPSNPNRVPALEAMSAIAPPRAAELLTRIVENSREDGNVRKPAAELLGKLKMPEGVAVLVKMLQVAPADLATFVARGLSWSNEGGDALIGAIEQGKASPLLLNDGVVSHELKFREVPNKDVRLEELKKSIPTVDEAIRQLTDERRALIAGKPGNADRGRAIFDRSCGICHQIAGKGAKIGPQLDGVGVRGLERLLEDTLDPDRNVDQAFRKTTFLLEDGTVVAGLVLRNEGEVVIVADGLGKEQRVPQSAIDERQESKLSPMPNDVAKSMPPEEFADLIAYLLSQAKK